MRYLSCAMADIVMITVEVILERFSLLSARRARLFDLGRVVAGDVRGGQRCCSRPRRPLEFFRQSPTRFDTLRCVDAATVEL